MLVHRERLNCSQFVVVNTSPNVSEISRGHVVFAGLDKVSGYRVGSGWHPRSASKLTKPLEYHHIIFLDRKCLCHTIKLRNASRNGKRFPSIPCQTPPEATGRAPGMRYSGLWLVQSLSSWVVRVLVLFPLPSSEREGAMQYYPRQQVGGGKQSTTPLPACVLFE